MGGCFTTTTKDINMKNITDGKPQQSQEMADGGQTRNKAASEIPRNTDSLNSSQGSVGVSNRSHGDGSRGHDIGTPSMDNAYRQWEKPTKSPQQAPVGVHVEDAPGNSRSRGDGSDGKDLNEKIQRFKDKHKVGTDGKTSKYTHRRSLSATTSSSEDSPGGRSLFRKRSSTFSIGDSKDSSRRRQTPNSTNMNNSGAGGRGGARPFGILSVLKEMNETGSFSRPSSNSMGQLEGLPVADKTTSELTYTTTPMSGILPANKPRSNSAAPAFSTSGTTTTTTMGSSSSSSTSSESAGSSTTTTPSTTTTTLLSKNSTSKSSTPTPVITPVQTVTSSSTSSSISSTNVTVHQTSFPFTPPTTSTITTSSSFSVSNDGSAYTASSPSLSSSTTALLNPSPHSKPNSSTYEDSPTKGATEDRPLLIPSSSEYEPRKSLLSGNRKTLTK